MVADSCVSWAAARPNRLGRGLARAQEKASPKFERTPHEMDSMLHREGGSLMATHHCAAMYR
jgi:hypothetical protein